jgi:predicted PhzF superfamily epimerase YddE/YHI9
MLTLPLFQVDAFAARPFEGNPAAVCPLTEWLPDELMLAIAAENNLSETAFFVREANGYRLRWFTPATEVDLCGHATLAAATVLFERLGHDEPRIDFASRSGPLAVRRSGERYTLDFPADPPVAVETPGALVDAFGNESMSCALASDLIAVFDSSDAVRRAEPDIATLASVDARGIIITAADDDYDFVARFFGPRVGVDEDPVTGSAYTQLAPYWASVTGKTDFRARQVSKRGGNVDCHLEGNRVHITGSSIIVLEGSLNLAV